MTSPDNGPLPLPPADYDAWLALTEDEQIQVNSRVWNAYERDGIAFAYMAGARLAMSCGRKVLEMRVGTYHGGEYVLHLEVSREEHGSCPPSLEQRFEGFRVIWIPHDTAGAVGKEWEGRWLSEDASREFELKRTAAGMDVTGRLPACERDLVISRLIFNSSLLMFSTYDAQENIDSHHRLRLVETDVMEDNLSRTVRMKRQSGENGQ